MKICLINAIVIPMTPNQQPEKSNLFLENGIITNISTNAPGPDYQVIDVEGCYIMPGLHDMHVHIDNDTTLPLYLVNGVTAIRNMSGDDRSLKLKKEISEGKFLGPTIHNTGPILDGEEGKIARSIKLKSPQEATAEVMEEADKGYEFIKTYPQIPVDIYNAIVNATNSRGLKIVGHGNENLSYPELIDSGYYSVEHANNLPDDEAEMIQAAEAGMWSVPTLCVISAVQAMAVDGKCLDLADYEDYLTKRDLEAWEKAQQYYKTTPRFKTFDISKFVRKVQMFHRYSNHILLGTDAYMPFILPGYSVHDELANLVNLVGMSNEQALMAGTVLAAQNLGTQNKTGTIEVGKHAELLVLEANPLENVANCKKIRGVMHLGKWHDKESLKEMEENVKASVRKTELQ